MPWSIWIGKVWQRYAWTPRRWAGVRGHSGGQRGGDGARGGAGIERAAPLDAYVPRSAGVRAGRAGVGQHWAGEGVGFPGPLRWEMGAASGRATVDGGAAV